VDYVPNRERGEAEAEWNEDVHVDIATANVDSAIVRVVKTVTQQR
jgi:hypothetical protein